MLSRADARAMRIRDSGIIDGTNEAGILQKRRGMQKCYPTMISRFRAMLGAPAMYCHGRDARATSQRVTTDFEELRRRPYDGLQPKSRALVRGLATEVLCLAIRLRRGGCAPEQS